MLTAGNQPVIKYENFDQTIKELGNNNLLDAEARVVLTAIFRSHLAFTFELISGYKLLPIQEMILKAIYLRDNSLIVAARGFGKSFLIAVFSILTCILYPGSKIVLLSANFRASRKILEEIFKMVNDPNAILLKQCFCTEMSRKNDMFSWKIPNGSEIAALPLSNGEGLRGIRASVVIIDEGLLISKEIQENVLRPFLAVKSNLKTRMEFKEIEDELIKKGLITEADRISYGQKNKFIIFSSASYEFQYLYEIYCNYTNEILKDNSQKSFSDPTYFVARLGYEAYSKEDTILDESVIKAAEESGGKNSDYFKREYEAMFIKGGGGYFSAEKMHECTFKYGDELTTQIKGSPETQYGLSLDPSYSSSDKSDYFAMGVFMLVPEQRKIIQVHSMSRTGSGKDLGYVYDYLIYILKSFNIVFCQIDDTGSSQFVAGFNLSENAKKAGIELKYIDAEPHKQNDYEGEIKKMKVQYNKLNKKIVTAFKFSADSALLVNEHLQNQINAKKVWFAAPMVGCESKLNEALQFKLPFEAKNLAGEKIAKDNMLEFIEEQDSMIIATKNQTAMIEVRSTSLGAMQFDLPASARRETGVKRARKDNYTTLLLGCWGAKVYYDMLFAPEEKIDNSFSPIIIY